MAKRTGRPKNQLPTCYYEGYLEKRSFKDKTSRKLWTCLCGNTLFFFNDKRDSDYIEKVELSGLISITDDSSVDRNLDAARLNLQTKEGNIKFTAPTAEARELWKGFIHAVAQLSIPSSLNLLPGQIHMLKEAVDKEKERLYSTAPPASATATTTTTTTTATAAPSTSPPSSTSPYVSLLADMPICFHKVSRLEAELLLDREAAQGNLLLRPGRNGSSAYAVTTRQDLNGLPVFKHYRVIRRREGGFFIDVENPVPCTTLHDVINYLVGQTEGVLIPLVFEEAYEKSISFIQSDGENGEKSIHQAQTNPVPPTLPPKPVSLRIPIPEPVPAPAADAEESVYLNDMPPAEEEKQAEANPPVPPPLEKKPPKKAIMPPVAAPRKTSTCTPPPPSTTSSTGSRMRANTDPMGQAISELKLKLEQKAKIEG